jgi:hypothetical protein
LAERAATIAVVSGATGARAYDNDTFRQACRNRGTDPIIPQRKTTGVKGLDKLRYVVEQTFALLHQSADSLFAGNGVSTSTTASSASPAS